MQTVIVLHGSPAATRLPGLDFAELEIWQGQKEGRAQVIPQTITGEIEKIDDPSRSCGVDLGTPPAGLCAPAVGSRPRSRSIPCQARTPRVGPVLNMVRIPYTAWNTPHGPRHRGAHRASISLRRASLL